MALSNAERQHRYRQRLKVRAAILPGAGLYEAAVEHLRTLADADGMIRRGYRPPKRERLSPEDLATEICLKAQEQFQHLARAIASTLRLNDAADERYEETSACVYACLGKIEATLAPPNVAARLATLDQGRPTNNPPIGGFTEPEAAQQLNVQANT